MFEAYEEPRVFTPGDVFRDHYLVEDKKYPLRYGMTATAEVVVRERRLIDLALDPFRQIGG